MSIPQEGAPQFDELYVVSDLHLGGRSGYQIFDSGVELARLIDYLCGLGESQRVGLVINGDFVDFLAEPNAKAFDPEGAIAKLNRIAEEDDAFSPVFKALQKFTGTPNRRLVLTLGNHDLELALPWVRARLLEILSGRKEEAYARITLAFDGAGFPCRVGRATVLCVHGNEVDLWNVADYEHIRRFGVEVSQGRPIDSWVPNAGTQLVIDVMNGVKRDYPFIDLLKPEREAAVPTLIALAPDQRDKLAAIAATVLRLERDWVRRAARLLGGEAEDEDGNGLTARAAAAADIFAPRPGVAGAPGPQPFDRELYAQALLDRASENYHNKVDPMSLLGSDELGSHLGMGSTVYSVVATAINRVRGMDSSEALRAALAGVSKDESFNPAVADIDFRRLDETVGDGFDFLIAGHTHLARALKRQKRYGYYFNSGTWARLIKLEERVLQSPDEFRKVFETFGQKSMQKLDDHDGLVTHRLSVVALVHDGRQTVAELRQVAHGDAPGGLWGAVEGSFTC